METAILLLAAGSSSRMGQSKQLLKVNGVPLLVHAFREGLAVTSNAIVVLGANYEQHTHALGGHSATIVENKAWQKGMGSSLKLGMAHLLTSTPKIDAVIIMVCDQPNVSTAHLQKLVAKAVQTNKTIVASSYSGIVGVPALFKKAEFGRLLNADDETGARKIIRQEPAAVVTVDFPNGHIDLDTPEDYAQFIIGNPHNQDAP